MKIYIVYQGDPESWSILRIFRDKKLAQQLVHELREEERPDDDLFYYGMDEYEVSDEYPKYKLMYITVLHKDGSVFKQTAKKIFEWDIDYELTEEQIVQHNAGVSHAFSRYDETELWERGICKYTDLFVGESYENMEQSYQVALWRLKRQREEGIVK